MSLGLQVWNADGSILIDLSTRIGRVYQTWSSGVSDGSLAVAGLADGGEPFFFVEDNSQDLTLAQLYSYPNVSINGSVVSWSFVDYQLPGGGTSPRRAVNISAGTF